MSLTLSICVLLISLMQSVNGAQLLHTTSLSSLFEFTACGGTSAILIWCIIFDIPLSH